MLYMPGTFCTFSSASLLSSCQNKTRSSPYLMVGLLLLLRHGCSVGTMSISTWIRRLVERGPGIGGSWRGPIARHSRSRATTAHLGAHLLLLCVQSRRPRLQKSVLDGPHNIWRKDGCCVDGSRHRLLPRLQHFLELLSSPLIDRGVHIHERLVEVFTKIQRVGRADILDDGVQQIGSWQLSLGRRLLQVVSGPDRRSLDTQTG